MSTAILIQPIGAAFSLLPDARGQSNNQRYVMADAALSAFSIFFTQSPSFLDSQVRMQKRYLDGFRGINDTFLIALDGTDFFSSEQISCPCCTRRH